MKYYCFAPLALEDVGDYRDGPQSQSQSQVESHSNCHQLDTNSIATNWTNCHQSNCHQFNWTNCHLDPAHSIQD